MRVPKKRAMTASVAELRRLIIIFVVVVVVGLRLVCLFFAACVDARHRMTVGTTSRRAFILSRSSLSLTPLFLVSIQTIAIMRQPMRFPGKRGSQFFCFQKTLFGRDEVFMKMAEKKEKEDFSSADTFQHFFKWFDPVLLLNKISICL